MGLLQFLYLALLLYQIAIKCKYYHNFDNNTEHYYIKIISVIAICC